MEPRKPTDKEKRDLFLLEVQKIGCPPYPDEGRGGYDAEDEENIMGQIEQACIAVFDKYISDGPGYFGSVMVVVWSGGPEYHSVYVWDKDGKIEEVNKEGA